MEMYKRKTLYDIDPETHIDEFGIDHSNFSTRDMLDYNFNIAAQQKQNQINMNKTQYAQNNLANVMSDAITPNKPITFDDVYYYKSNKNSDNLGTLNLEGGFNDRNNDLGGPTNFGIRQASLDEYNAWNHPLRKGFGFPTNVKDLTIPQGKQIADEMYYQRYGINRIKNLDIARNVFDEEFNQGTAAPQHLANITNNMFGTNFFAKDVVPRDLADYVSNLSPEEIIKLNDAISDNRMKNYFGSVDATPDPNVNNILGWYNRLHPFYSNPDEFEQKYKSQVDDYRFNKYKQYYNRR